MLGKKDAATLLTRMVRDSYRSFEGSSFSSRIIYDVVDPEVKKVLDRHPNLHQSYNEIVELKVALRQRTEDFKKTALRIAAELSPTDEGENLMKKYDEDEDYGEDLPKEYSMASKG